MVLTLSREKDSPEWNLISTDTPFDDVETQDDTILKLIDFMKNEKDFCGTASELTEKLNCKISGNALSRKLKKYEQLLKENGIEFVKSRTGERREILAVYSANDDMTINFCCGVNSTETMRSVS